MAEMGKSEASEAANATVSTTNADDLIDRIGGANPYLDLPPELARNAKRLRKPPGTVTDWTFLRGYRVMFQGEEVLTVAGCVGAVVNVFDKSCSYVEQIKEISDADTSDLKISLVRGKEVVRSQYARESKKLGWVFAQGDDLALETLRDVMEHMFDHVFLPLSKARKPGVGADYSLAQDISDESQDRAIICLMQLTQRLLAGAPINLVVAENPRMSATPSFDAPIKAVEAEPLSDSQGTSLHPQPDKHFGNHVEISGPGTLPLKKKTTRIFSFRRHSKSSEIAPFDATSTYSSGSVASQQTIKHPRIRHNPPRPDSVQPMVEEYREIVKETRATYLESHITAPQDLSHVSSSKSHAEGEEFDIAEYSQRPTTRSSVESVTPQVTSSSANQPRPHRQSLLIPEALNPRVVRERRDSIHEHDNSPTLGSACQRRSTVGSSGSPETGQPWMRDDDSPYNSTAPTSPSYTGPFCSSPDLTGYNSQESVESVPQHAGQKAGPKYNWIPRPQRQQKAIDHGPPNITPATFPVRPRIPPSIDPQAPPQVPPRAASRPMLPLAMSQPLTPTDETALTQAPPPPPRRSTHSSATSSQNRASMSTDPSVAPVPVRVVHLEGFGSASDYLPTLKNEYAGFCKGAWLAQVGETRKAYEHRQEPATTYAFSNVHIHQCKSCEHRGRAVLDAKGKTSIDTDVYGADGILYRWEFLFKSHIKLKRPKPHFVEQTYGCMFCTAEGRGTPIFEGQANFLRHLHEHRERQPTGEVLYRMRCVVGRSPEIEEDFDVALPPLRI